MAVKERHMETQSVYPLAESEPQISLISSWLTGLILLVMVMMAVSIVNAAVSVPHTGSGQGDNPQLVLPEGSSMPGVRNADAMETVADSRVKSIDSGRVVPNTTGCPEGMIENRSPFLRRSDSPQ